MPLYEYECDANGHRFEVIQKFSDAPIETCPTCGSTVHKLMSSPAIQFKGTGWYITDYARSSKGESGGETKSETKSEAKSETKSETKTESKGETATASTPTSASPAPSDKN